jgi:diguanylate cyclase (GGDEF)-like protein/PAS domain S-box-containing protein
MAERPSTPVRVLLVDDDEDDYLVTRGLLAEIDGAAYRLDWVTGYDEAVRAAAGQGHDVYLVDHRLGERSGLDLVRHLVADGPHLPVILLTGAADDQTDLAATAAGAVDHLVKGRIDAPLLERSIRYAVRQASALARLRESEERYTLAVRGANDGLWDWDLRSGRVYYSPRWKQLLGHAEDQIGDRPSEWLDRVHPDDQGQLRAKLSAHLTGHTTHFQCEHRMRHADGSQHWMLSRGVAIHGGDGPATRMAGSQSDVTERKQAEERLAHGALHDALTGLANRLQLMERLDHCVKRAQRSASARFAVLYLDIDRFKAINDSLGHQAGDRLLVMFARRLQWELRGVDTLARLGADEFAVLLDSVGGLPDALRVTERIQDVLRHPFQLGDRELVVTASFGVASSATGYQRPEEALRDADTAMHRAKALGKARCEVFDVGMHAEAVAAFELEADLRLAAERGELGLDYQPVVALDSGQVAGFQVLLEWRHPARGLLPHRDFAALAEDSGLSIEIGAWTLAEACRQAGAWPPPPDGVAPTVAWVRLSAKELARPGLADTVTQALAGGGLDPERLRLAVAEDAVVEHPYGAKALAELRTAGVRVVMDDLGKGRSSLRQLHRLPVDLLRFDLPADDGDGAWPAVATVATMAASLGVGLALTGVDTPARLARAREAGALYAQGRLFDASRPAGSGLTGQRPPPETGTSVPGGGVHDGARRPR